MYDALLWLFVIFSGIAVGAGLYRDARQRAALVRSRGFGASGRYRRHSFGRLGTAVLGLRDDRASDTTDVGGLSGGVVSRDGPRAVVARRRGNHPRGTCRHVWILDSAVIETTASGTLGYRKSRAGGTDMDAPELRTCDFRVRRMAGSVESSLALELRVQRPGAGALVSVSPAALPRWWRRRSSSSASSPRRRALPHRHQPPAPR